VSERVFIVGAGQVGVGLFRAFRAARVEVVGLHSRRHSSVATSSGQLPSAISDANAIIVAVRDDQLDGVLADLVDAAAPSGRRRLASGTVVVHTSGGAEPELLSRLGDMGLSGGTFHPLVPFANPDRAPELLRRAWVGIDGDDPARAMSRRLAGHIGARTLEIPPGRKPAYHAAAILASNFPVVLASVAGHLLHDIGVPDASAYKAVESLMAGALTNMKQALPDDALTGPIVRGDAETVGKHIHALQGHEQALQVYRALSHAAVEIARARGVDSRTLAAISALLRTGS